MLLLSITDPDMLKQTKDINHEINTKKNLALGGNTQTENVKRIYGVIVLRKVFFVS